jgi:hypothetical protein
MLRRRPGASGCLVEHIKVAVGELQPHIGGRQHSPEHAGEGGFLLADPAAPAASPSVARLPPDELWGRALCELGKAELVQHARPEQRGGVRHNEPCRLDGVLGSEVVVSAQFADQFNELLHCGRSSSKVIGKKRMFRAGDQIMERESPSRPFTG